MFAKSYRIYYMKKKYLNMSLSPALQEQCDEPFLSSAMTSQTPSWWWSPCLLGNLPINIETWGQVMCTEKKKACCDDYTVHVCDCTCLTKAFFKPSWESAQIFE